MWLWYHLRNLTRNNMKTYQFQINHDKGSQIFNITGSDVNSAKQSLLTLENAPESAIQWWRVVPTAKQIKKTKNMLRNL